METLAYIHLCTLHEEADLNQDVGFIKLFEGFNWQSSSSAGIHLTSILITLSILSLSSSSFAYTARVRTNGSDLNVRTGPGLGYRVVEDLPNGTPIRLNGNRSDRWSQLSRVRDWVSSDWISRRSGGSHYHISSSGGTSRVSRYSPYIASLQQRLQSLRDPNGRSYFTGRITGFYGSKTESAVKRYQADTGLPEYGIDALLAQGGESPGTTPTSIAPYRTLRYSSRGEDVSNLQARLQTLGYLTAQTTGIYDRTTGEAVRSFKSKNGLQPLTRDADVQTQNALYADSAIAASDTSNGQPSAQITPSHFLHYSSRGQDVTQLQESLQQLGLFNGSITGFYDHTTESAVTAFQRRYLNTRRPNGNASTTVQQAVLDAVAGNFRTYQGT